MTEKHTDQISAEVPSALSDNLSSTTDATEIGALSEPHHGQSQRWWLRGLYQTALAVAVGLFLIVAVGFAQRLGWISSGGGGGDTHAAAAGDGKVYVCPMMCTPLRSPEPASCPVCGMDLAPVAAGNGNQDEFAVYIEPAARRVANIATATATSTTMDRSIRSIGSIAIDESRQAIIAAYVGGRIEKMFADYKGVYVSEAEHMVILYSPELYAAQAEYLLMKKSADTAHQAASTSSPSSFSKKIGRQLLDDTREKLLELGMKNEQIEELGERGRAQKRLRICAPIGGTVIEKLKTEGQYVKAGDAIYRIADLSVVWLKLQLFPDDAAHIRYGQRVEAEVQSLPGEIFSGRVAFIDPMVDEKTRTVGVRVEILNTEGRLRPGDYAAATIKIPIASEGEVYDVELAGKWISPRHPQIVRDQPGNCPLSEFALISTSELGYAPRQIEKSQTIVVPRNAVLMAGSNSVVYVETEPGRFEIRPVTLGYLTQKQAVILHGIKSGEMVATSGNFLIDSQMQLAGNPSLIDPTRAIQRDKKAREEKKNPGPLEFDSIHVEQFAGELGGVLDALYVAYFTIQRSLADDQPLTQATISKLVSATDRLLGAAELTDEIRSHVQPVAEHARKLQAGDIEASREQFKPISHAVVRLASKARGQKGSKPFIHFFCPMVKGGGGDWLQADGPLLNPYFGSQMLHCGKKVHEFAFDAGPQQKHPAPRAERKSRAKRTTLAPSRPANKEGRVR